MTILKTIIKKMNAKFKLFYQELFLDGLYYYYIKIINATKQILSNYKINKNKSKKIVN